MQVQANIDSLIALTSRPWRPLELPAGSPQCLKSLLLLVSVELRSISLPYCSSPEKKSSLPVRLSSAPFLFDSLRQSELLKHLHEGCCAWIWAKMRSGCPHTQGSWMELLGPGPQAANLQLQGASPIYIYLSFPVGSYKKRWVSLTQMIASTEFLI